MSFTVIPIGAGTPDDGFSQPNMVSFCVADSGAGGQIFVNGLGVLNAVVSGAVDLKTLFGSAFRSFPLLRAFRIAASANAAEAQFVQNLEVVLTTIGGTGLAAMPAVTYLYGIGSGPSNAPYLAVAGPSVSGAWRIDIRLRHSITN